MKLRKFDITIISANNLPNVRRPCVGRMQVYSVVLMDGKSSTTNSDREGDRSPRWNQTLNYIIDESCVTRPGSFLVVKLYCNRKWHRDKQIGDDVRIEIKSLFDRGHTSENSVPYIIPKTNGSLNISFTFGAVFVPEPSTWKKLLGYGFGLCNCISVASTF